MKLSEIIRVQAHKSGVDIICEVNTSHLTRKYLELSVIGARVTQEMLTRIPNDDMDRPPVPPTILMLRVCPICFVEFMASIHTTAMELNT
jgi:hypothetical protein